MSRTINSDQRSPSISTEAFSGQPDRRFEADCFRAILIHCNLSLAFRKLNVDTIHRAPSFRIPGEKSMNRKMVKTIALGALALGVVLGTAWPAQAQAARDPYPKMAPIDEYLIGDRNAEIALARSAAPESISRDATVVVFGPHGYETAVEGKNGFVCIVERGWMNLFDNPEFWSPKVRGPICFNPPAARTVLPIT